ncbi:307_t:CDS:2 [Funneliformis geosporum]|uniref:17868_t:CDS:1 n=1 Tax=Funneliformis geosporum TaxID=1117311 RepID=A0A9W4SSA8_9GLOM|nr:17868_t:CDS:2 [Funneliformis geosporum]CAI2183132.1 307_t:CDS:2 [Funneliformis geosporum]
MTGNNNINQYVDKKPFELVQELKEEYQIPSFEEFMKTYKCDDALNYDDLKGGRIGEVKGCGPCPDGCERRMVGDKVGYYAYQYQKTGTAAGDGANRYACSSSEALGYAHDLEDNN